VRHRFLLRALVFVVACSWAATFVAAGEAVPSRLFSGLGTATTAAALAIFLFDIWAWRLPFIGGLIKRPDLRGTWAGTITPLDPTTKTPKPPVEAYAVVRQTYTTLHVRLFTAESVSISLVADLVDEADGAQLIATVYRNEPRRSVADRSAVHHGGTRLRIVGVDGGVMSGPYWTDRWTCGEMTLQRRAREVATDFETAKAAVGDGLHPRALLGTGGAPPPLLPTTGENAEPMRRGRSGGRGGEK
jgi:hypothetical protein